MIEVLLVLAILSIFISSGIFLALKYKELSTSISRTSEIEAVMKLVENHLRHNSRLRDLIGNDDIDDFMISLKSNLNEHYLPLSGFDSFEISSLSYDGVQGYSDLYRFTVAIMDKATNKEVMGYVFISSL
ncbi:hypothetical protein AT15_10130 [Kosmotoga arenicorallina S304]|uniref:Type II secretion system protein n=1 Tax=Kosmotoga arenicorallina S304 TaxID=1453497 RepID=A0A176K1A0_9BACT|nr:hypothetical protein [Kosmotoga arenicorallina]OAA30632.1 hypothetical protein AT15_10130 [Kosmotoga arenicorallina S304]